MKRFLSIIITFAAVVSAAAQNYDYQPRETWPHLLEEFSIGVVRTPGGRNLSEGRYNICVVDGKLHYIAGSKIMEADMNQVQIVSIGETVYINRLGKMMQVIAEKPGANFLILNTYVDNDELDKSSIGYGVKSATASTQKLNNIGVAGSMLSMELEAAIADSKSGLTLPLNKRYYFLLGPKQVEATKRNFLELPGIDKASAKAFLKQEKIKWHNPESLVKVLGYIVENSK